MTITHQPKLRGGSLFGLLSFLCLWLLLGPQSLQAQITCQEKIALAEEKYNAGLFQEVLDMRLDSCIQLNDEFFPREQKLRAYRILILIDLYRDQSQAAKDRMQLILNLDPEFTPIEDVDPVEFRTMHGNFDTDPTWYIEPRVMFNFANPIVLNPYGIQDQDKQATDTTGYSSKLDFGLGVMVAKPITKDISIGFGAFYSRRFFSYKESLPVSLNSGSESLELTFDERQQWLDVPVTLRLNLRVLPGGLKNILIPYVFGGATGHFLLRANLRNIQRNLVDIGVDKQGSSKVIQVTTDKINLFEGEPLRNRANFSLTGGAGLQYKVGYNYVVFEYQTGYMLRSLARGDNRYSNKELLYTYGYIDDDFTQVTQTLSLGFKHIFYNPKLK